MKYISIIKSFFSLIAAHIFPCLDTPLDDYYVIGSNYGAPPDSNAMAMAEYLRAKQCPFFIVTDDPDLFDDEVIKRGSLKSARLMLGAKGVFYTHSLSDVLPGGHRLFFLKSLLKFPPLVFMQHGIIALKRMTANGRSLGEYIRSLDKTFDYIVVSSVQEREFVIGMGISKDKIAVVGLPRFDTYDYAVESNKNNVLIFFTWMKNDLLNAKHAEVKSLPAIVQLVSDGYHLSEAKHPMQLHNEIHSERTHNAKKLKAAINNCVLLITDDSSVAWDVFYQGGDVLFYKPESEWFASDAWLVDRVCNSLGELDEKLNKWTEGTMLQVPKFTEFQDQQNCARVFALIN